MTLAAETPKSSQAAGLSQFAGLSAEAASAAERLLGRAIAAARAAFAPDGKIDPAMLDGAWPSTIAASSHVTMPSGNGPSWLMPQPPRSSGFWAYRT